MNQIWNTVFPTKIYVILDANGRVLDECISEYSHHALKMGQETYGPAARTAMLKTDYLRLEKESKWLRAAARVEA